MLRIVERSNAHQIRANFAVFQHPIRLVSRDGACKPIVHRQCGIVVRHTMAGRRNACHMRDHVAVDTLEVVLDAHHEVPATAANAQLVKGGQLELMRIVFVFD